MAKAGDELVNPVTGLRTVFRKTARQTSGELLQVDWIGEPGWTTGPDHDQEERFEVLSGKLGLRVEGVERVLGEGEAITAPAGSAHPPPDPPFGGCSSTRPGGTLLGKSHERWLCTPLTGVENRMRRDTE